MLTTTVTLDDLLQTKEKLVEKKTLEEITRKYKPVRSLCENSDYSETLAFKKLGFIIQNQVASESLLSSYYPKKKVPDAIFSSLYGNIAIEVKRVKNVVHKDTVINALEKLYDTIVDDFEIKAYHIVFQTRGIGPRDKVSCIMRDVHGILKKTIKTTPYKLPCGPNVFIHVQKVGEVAFKNIGYN